MRVFSRFIKKNYAIILLASAFVIIGRMVPLASGDDWTFRTWYGGLQAVPQSLLWQYLFFNGRSTMNVIFSFLLYYFDLWFLVTPLSMLLIFWSLKILLKLDQPQAQFLMATLFLCFSWTISRNVYLWPCGNGAYVLPWAIMLWLFALTHKYSMPEHSHWKFISFCIALGLFLMGFGNENASVALFAMEFMYCICHRVQNKQFSKPLVLYAVVSALSAGLCIFCPAGHRFEVAMQSVTVPFSQMVRNNTNIICYYLLQKNGFLFLAASGLVLLLFKTHKMGISCSWLRKMYLGFISFCTLILSITMIPTESVLKATGYLFPSITKIMDDIELFSKQVFQDHIILSLICLFYIICLIISVFFLKGLEEHILVWISLFSFAIVSVGVFLVLPEISERSMFYALTILIFYCGFLLQQIELKPFRQKQVVVLIALIFFVRFDAFMYVLVPAKAVTAQRQAIVDMYHIQAGLGQADNITCLYFPRYADGSINWSESNMNPEKENNPYAYEAMKDYYGIPENVEVVMVPQKS